MNDLNTPMSSLELDAWALYCEETRNNVAWETVAPAVQAQFRERVLALRTHIPVYRSATDVDTVCMAEAYVFAQFRSKDPNTKVGACVYDPVTGGLFLGYNGFPAGVPDLKSHWDNRNPASPDCKYNRVVHAEANATRKAMQAVGQLDKCTLYVTHYPCHRCMKDFIIPSGLKQVVYLSDAHFDALSNELAREAGVGMRKAPASMQHDMFIWLQAAAAKLTDVPGKA